MAMLEERQQTIKIKTLLMQCYMAEAKFATFLMQAAEKYGSSFQLDDLLHLKDANNKIGRILIEIQASDASYHQNDSDDNVPKPLPSNA